MPKYGEQVTPHHPSERPDTWGTFVSISPLKLELYRIYKPRLVDFIEVKL